MRVLLVCHYFSSYMKDLIEQLYKQCDLKVDLLTADSSYYEKVNQKALGNIYYFESESNFGVMLNKLNDYDVIEIHFLMPFYSDYTELIMKKARQLNICIWGSDFYTMDSTQRLIQNILVKRADRLIFGNPDTAKNFVEYYNCTGEKISICRFGLSILDEIQEVQEKEIKLFKKTHDIPEDMKVVTIGHNGSPNQQHEEIMNILSSSEDNYLDNVHVIIPMTYGRTEEYLFDIKNVVEQSSLHFTLLDEYMSDREVAILRRVTDVFVQLQLTDQLSGSMQEHIFAGSLVITGSWLPYKIFNENGIKLFKIDEIDNSLNQLLKKLLTMDDGMLAYNNAQSVYRDASWKHLAAKWFSNYRDDDLVHSLKLREYRNSILEAINQNNQEKMLEAYSVYVKEVPKDSDFYSFESIVSMLLGNNTLAMENILNSIEINPTKYDFWYNYTYLNKLDFNENYNISYINAFYLSETIEEKDALKELEMDKEVNIPLLTIGVISYNSAHYIKYCLESILSQKYKNIEILIVDDASSDNTREIIKEYCSRYSFIKVFYHEKNTGCQSRAIQKMISIAKGKYLSLISYDDAYHNEYSLLRFVTELELNTELDFVYSDMGIINEHSVCTDVWNLNPISPEEVVSRTYMTGSGAIPIGMGVFRTSFLKSLNDSYIMPNKVNPKGNSGADTLNVMYYILNNMQYKNISELLMSYRIHSNNLSHSIESRIRSNFQVQKFIVENYDLKVLDEKLYKLCLSSGLNKKDTFDVIAAIHIFEYYESYINGGLIPAYIQHTSTTEEIVTFCDEYLAYARERLKDVDDKNPLVIEIKEALNNLDESQVSTSFKIDDSIIVENESRLKAKDIEGFIGIAFYGRSGSVFLQSLLDNHPEIVMLPGLYLLDYGNFWSFAEQKCTSFESLIEFFLNYYEYLFNPKWRAQSSNSTPWDDIIHYCRYDQMGENEEYHLSVDRKKFIDELEVVLKEQGEINRSTFFISIQVAYFNVLNRPYVNGQKYKIVYPLHTSLVIKSHHQWFLEDFPDAKILYSIREPLKNITSTVKYYEKFDMLNDHALMNIFYYSGLLTGPKQLFEGFDLSRVIAVKLENLHMESRETLERIADFIEISWDEILLKSTFNGHLWWNFRDTKKVNGFNKNIIDGDISDYLDEFDVFRIKWILSNLYKAFGYEMSRTIDNNLLDELMSYPFKFELKNHLTNIRRQEFIGIVRQAMEETQENFNMLGRIKSY